MLLWPCPPPHTHTYTPLPATVHFHSVAPCVLPQDDLLDLYLYYCLIGMSVSSPSLRAASVAMLSVIVVHNVDVVIGAAGVCTCMRLLWGAAALGATRRK